MTTPNWGIGELLSVIERLYVQIHGSQVLWRIDRSIKINSGLNDGTLAAARLGEVFIVEWKHYLV